MRCRCVIPTVLLGLWTLLPSPATAAAPRHSIVFILDCSKAMADAMPAGEGIHEVGEKADDSRFDVARDALKAVLTELAGQGDHEVAIWLFGHRLSWNGEDRSELVEQAGYLEQTLGFNVLAELLPGDDVELARPLTKLTPADLEPVFARLDAAKPWGESPLYLAIERALESLNRRASGADTTLVVFTEGLNEQSLARQPSKKDRVVAAAERRHVPVHLVAFGRANEPRRQSEAELRQIAATTRGSYALAENSAALTEAIAVALYGAAVLPTAPGAGERHDEEARSTTASSAHRVATPPALHATHSIEGTVTFYGRAVRKAKVKIEGSSESPVVTDASGNFTFDKLPPGSYKLIVEAVVKNVIREQTKILTIAETAEPAVVVVEIALE